MFDDDFIVNGKWLFCCDSFSLYINNLGVFYYDIGVFI